VFGGAGQEAGGADRAAATRAQRGPAGGAVPGGRRVMPEPPGMNPQAQVPRQAGAPGSSGPAGYGAASPSAPVPGARDGYERFANGYGPGPQQRFEPGPYDGAVHQQQFESAPAFDAPTTEFYPGPMFDEPVVPAVNGVAGVGPANAGHVGVAGVVGVNGVHPAAGPAAGQQPMAAPGAWTAEPVAAAAAAPAPVQPGPVRTDPQQRADGGYGGGLSSSRPPMPDEPVPGPPPLPTRPSRAERIASGRTPPRGTALPTTPGGGPGTGQTPLPEAAPPVAQQQPETEAPAPQEPPSRPSVFTPPSRDPQQQAEPVPPSVAAAAAARETLMPPRRPTAQPHVQPQPQVQAAPAQPARQVAAPPMAPRPAAAEQAQHGDELAGERLRSVAPMAPARPQGAQTQGAQTQGAQSQGAQPPAQTQGPQPLGQSQGAVLHGSGSFADLAEQEAAEHGDDADEMIVPWQAAPAPAQEAPQADLSASGQVPVHEQPAPVQENGPAAPESAQPEAPAAPGASGQEPGPAPRGTRRRIAEPATAAAGTRAAAPARKTAGQPAASVQPASVSPASVSSTSASSAAARPRVRAVQAEQQPVALQEDALQEAEYSAEAGGRAPGYDDDALAAVYRVIHERRDVRNDFLSDEVPTEVLTRILEAAHTAPSVGFSQPWDFLVIREPGMRKTVHDLAVRQRRAYAASLPKARARAFATLKIEAILDTPVNIVVTCDPTRGGRHTLGRYTQPLMAPFSSCLAVENLWLAARAEGLGVGWVSFFDERELAAVLDLPAHLQVVAYLCVGYVKQFPPEPELAGAGWAKRRPLAWAVHEERFGHRALPGAEPVSLLSETVDAIRGLDPGAVIAARDRQSRMTKPPGSLGTLEAVAEQLAGLAGVCPPPMPEPAALAVFAGDHGVHAQGVTPWPQEVTAQMVANFLAGGAVVNAFAKQVGAEVCVVDIGVNARIEPQAGLIPRKIRYGTADMTQGPALTREEVTAALEAGIETARDLVAAGNRCLLTGDMGITNTTASAALIAAFTGASPAQVTGYGTGIDEQTYAHKVEVVARALELHRPDPQDPVGVLSAFGGLEHAALAGFILAAAALRVPVVLDGVIAGASALVAQAFCPDVTSACVAGHRSAEPGHALALEALGVTPLIDLELRLGEGSGAALALPLVAAAVRALREVATFDDAGVADASDAAVVPPTERERA
jgi:nicotinate-nucleotide--dimethylbenzimidazole phosphoribosyltransferase